jgi:penicillin amidase
MLKLRARRAGRPDRGTLDLPGLHASVEVHFDAYGVPHIRAQNDADAFCAQGYCHARDRFFQMDMLRRALSGRLSETVGERALASMALPSFAPKGTTVDADRLMRVLGLRDAARRVWAAGDATARALLEAYVAGVNAAVRRMRRRRPLEHRLLKMPLEPWRPVDSILVAKGMALGLSFKWRAAPVFAAAAERLAGKPAHLEQMLPPLVREGAPAISRCVARGVGAALSFLPLAAPTRGSNAWVLGGGRTRSGRPLLANDPHLELGLPGVWYLASVRARAYRAVGASLPGLPGIVIGRTPGVAWGLTNAMLDDADLWVETLDERGTRYRVDGAWRPLEMETHAVERRGAPPHLLRIRRTHRGPLLSDAFRDYDGPPLSIRFTLHEPTRDMEAFLGLGRARTVDEALEAAALFGAPAQNLLVADREGRAVYRTIGLVPQRTLEDHPALLRDGTRSDSDWRGWVPPEEVPALEVGPDEHLLTANHPPVDGSYPHYLSHLYEPGYRAARIGALLEGRADLTADDMERMQGDATSPAARRFRESILVPHADAVRARQPALGPLIDRLLAWAGDESVDAAGAVPWHLVYHHLVRRTFTPHLGADVVRQWMGVMNLVDAALFDAFEREDSAWAPPRIRATLLQEALLDATADLARRGYDLDAPWGALHALTLKHPLGAARLLSPAFDRGPFPMPGGPYSVCSGQYRHAAPGPMVVGQSYLQVVDMADPEGGRMIVPGGQSGHVGSKHYDDLTPLWRAGKRLPMRLDALPEDAQVLRLVPG